MEKRHKENSFLHDLKIDLKTICKMLKKKYFIAKYFS